MRSVVGTVCLASMMGAALLSSPAAAATSEAGLSPKSLQQALASTPTGADAEHLAEAIRQYFGKENLLKGSAVKADELTVAWALEAPAAEGAPKVVSDDNRFRLLLERVGSTDVYAAVR